MTTPQLMQIQQLAKANNALTAELNKATEELNQFQGVMDVTSPESKGTVIVTGNVYPGTKICIDDVSMVVKQAMKYCRFIKEAGDVKMVAIY